MYLWGRTFYSFHKSTLSVGDYTDYAENNSSKWLACSDYQNFYGMWEYIDAISAMGIKPVMGVEISTDDGGFLCFMKSWEVRRLLFELSSFILKNRILPFDFIEENIKKCSEYYKDIVFISLENSSFVKLRTIFGNNPSLYRGICEEDIWKGNMNLQFLTNKSLQEIPLFCSFYKPEFPGQSGFESIDKEDPFIFEVLKGIGEKTTYQSGRKKYSRIPVLCEPEKLCEKIDYLYGQGEGLKVREVLDKFVEKLCIENDYSKHNPVFSTYFHTKTEDDRALEKKVFGLLPLFYGKKENEREKARQRALYELQIIREKKFSSYFLFVREIVDYALERQIPFIGRGSAASSLVAYVLGITPVDPLSYDLYFERFLNPARSNPPDIDLDFSWKDRDKILDFIFEKYGQDKVAMIATRIRYNLRGAFREVCKYFGLPGEQITLVSKHINSWRIEADIEKKLEYIIESKELRDFQSIGIAKLISYSEKLVGFPHATGTHPGGICISSESIDKVCPVQNGSKGYRLTGFDMYSITNTGLIKIDILSQRALGVFGDLIKILTPSVSEKLTKPIEISGIISDGKMWEMIAKGDTIGFFYIESPGMRGLLKSLHCDNYELLVAASSVIRPGVADSGMKDQFVNYHRHPERIRYIIPEMERILGKTYGIMIYQEDVMKTAVEIGGFSFAQADMLRKVMNGKLRSQDQILKLEKQFLKNGINKGIKIAGLQKIWSQIESFAGFAFCKAHSASYATLSVKLAYCKKYFPEYFWAAVINNRGGYYPTEAYIYKAQQQGCRFLKSRADLFSESTEVIIRGGKHIILLGLDYLSFLSSEDIGNITKDKSYFCLEQFCYRTKFQKQKVLKLWESGFFDSFGEKRLNQYMRIIRYFSSSKAKREKTGGVSIFGNIRETDNCFPLTRPEGNEKPTAFSFQEALYDFMIYDFFVRENPFIILKKMINFKKEDLVGFNTYLYSEVDQLHEQYRQYKKHTLSCSDIPRYIGKEIIIVGYLITGRPTWTKKGEKMGFATFFDGCDFFEVILFPDIYPKAIIWLKEYRFFLLKGRVIEKDSALSLELRKIKPIYKKYFELLSILE